MDVGFALDLKSEAEFQVTNSRRSLIMLASKLEDGRWSVDLSGPIRAS
jgi:hypothetical protein